MDRKHYEPEHIAFGEAVRAFIDKEMVPNFLEWEQIGSAPRELFQVAGRTASSAWLCLRNTAEVASPTSGSTRR